jgi:hypothetical protein
VARAGFIALPVLQGSLGFCIEAKNVLYAQVPAGTPPAGWCVGGGGIVAFCPPHYGKTVRKHSVPLDVCLVGPGNIQVLLNVSWQDYSQW